MYTYVCEWVKLRTVQCSVGRRFFLPVDGSTATDRILILLIFFLIFSFSLAKQNTFFFLGGKRETTGLLEERGCAVVWNLLVCLDSKTIRHNIQLSQHSVCPLILSPQVARYCFIHGSCIKAAAILAMVSKSTKLAVQFLYDAS